MKTVFSKAILGLALGASALTVAAPAEAQRYGGRRHGDGTGTAIIAGVAGLAIGAAIASSANNDRYYDRGYDDYDGYDSYYYQPRYRGYYQQRYDVQPRYNRYRDHRRYDHRAYHRGH